MTHVLGWEHLDLGCLWQQDQLEIPDSTGFSPKEELSRVVLLGVTAALDIIYFKVWSQDGSSLCYAFFFFFSDPS